LNQGGDDDELKSRHSLELSWLKSLFLRREAGNCKPVSLTSCVNLTYFRRIEGNVLHKKSRVERSETIRNMQKAVQDWPTDFVFNLDEAALR
jgi:hypothetical protein